MKKTKEQYENSEYIISIREVQEGHYNVNFTRKREDRLIGCFAIHADSFEEACESFVNGITENTEYRISLDSLKLYGVRYD